MPFLGRTLDRGPTNIALTILQINWTTWINLERDYWKVQQTKYFDTAVQILNEQQCKYFDTIIPSNCWYLQNPKYSLQIPNNQQKSNNQLRLLIWFLVSTAVQRLDLSEFEFLFQVCEYFHVARHLVKYQNQSMHNVHTLSTPCVWSSSSYFNGIFVWQGQNIHNVQTQSTTRRWCTNFKPFFALYVNFYYAK